MRITATETVSELLKIDSSDRLEAWLKRVVVTNVLDDGTVLAQCRRSAQ